jgi:uracil-DNA glycosylase family 4
VEYCPDCPRRSGTFAGYPGAVGADGSDDAPVLVVGMSPGQHELAAGVPFVGASGALVWGFGGQVGLTRPDCKIVNTVCCWPCGPKGKTLTPKQLTACRPHLESVLRAFRGRVVLCLGAEAFEAVTGLISWERRDRAERAKRGGWSGGAGVGIEQWRGYLVRPGDCHGGSRTEMREVPDHNAAPYKTGRAGHHKAGDPRTRKVKIEVPVPRVLPPNVEWIVGALHPSYIMRCGKKNLPAFLNDVGRAVRAVKGDLEIVDVTYETTVPA